MADISHIKGPDNTSYDIKDATARDDISNLATVASTGEYSDLLHPPTVAEIDDTSTAADKAWSASKIGIELGKKVDKTGDPLIVKTQDIPEEAANLGTTATPHRVTMYRNGLSIPYQMDNTNDGGILRVRGTSESNCILELGTWDDSGAGETIQFNYYPTTSQVTPTYSVSVPKKSGTIALTSDVPDVSGKVNKSGDTMTGALTMNNVNVNVKDTDINIGTNPSSTIWGNGFYAQSNNAGDLWYIRSTQDTSGNAGVQLEVQRTVNGTRYFHNMRMGIANDGTLTTYFSNPASWRSAIGHPFEWDINTNNTTDTWVPVMTGSKMQHRVIPTAYNTAPGSVYTKNVDKMWTHTSSEYQNASSILEASNDGTTIQVSNLRTRFWTWTSNIYIDCRTDRTLAGIVYVFNGNTTEIIRIYCAGSPASSFNVQRLSNSSASTCAWEATAVTIGGDAYTRLHIYGGGNRTFWAIYGVSDAWQH